MTGWIERTRVKRVLRVAMAGLALALFTSGEEARALSYFDGPDGYGFDNDEIESVFEISDRADWARAGSRNENDGDFALVITASQKIKDKGNNRWRVVVEWNVKNKTGQTLENPILFLSALGTPPDYPNYEGIPIDIPLDKASDPFTVIEYEQDGVDYAFIGFQFLDMEPGAEGSRDRKFKYDIFADDLPDNTGPALGTAAVLDPVPVPESSIGWLLSAGLLASWRWRRRR